LLGLIPKVRHPGLRLIVTPGTVLRRRHDILRRRWARKSRRKGRPATRRNIKALVLQMAKENEGWGYRRIAGELAGLGITIAPSTVWAILKKAGIDPAPRRDGPTWATFLRSQAEAILATDFFTVGLLDGTTAYVLAMIEHATRRIGDPRRHRPPHRSLDHPDGPQRGDGPGRPRRPIQVSHPRGAARSSPRPSTPCSKPPASRS
jgi:transposase